MMGPASFPVDFPDDTPPGEHPDILVDHGEDSVIITVFDDDGEPVEAELPMYLAYGLGEHVCRAAGRAEFGGGETDE